MKRFEWVALVGEAHIGQARRLVRRCAADLGFSERQLAEIEIAVKEIGSNAVKFGRSTGQIFFAPMDAGLDTAGLEIIYIDKGSGIEDLCAALEDGFTTTDSLGTGLGAIKRMADEFYIHSTAQSQTSQLSMHGRTHYGTAIVFRKHLVADSRPPFGRRELWGALTRSAAGADSNGDAYIIKRDENRRLIAVIDGLGHGMGAKEAAGEAVASIEKHALEPLETILQATHQALRHTRGAVAGLAAIDLSAGVIEYAGIGNVDSRVLGGRNAMRLISLNGTLGSRMERIKVFREQLPKSAAIILASDGISERWDAESYPGLLGLHPELLCAVIMRDYARMNDDATIISGRLHL